MWVSQFLLLRCYSIGDMDACEDVADSQTWYAILLWLNAQTLSSLPRVLGTVPLRILLNVPVPVVMQ